MKESLETNGICWPVQVDSSYHMLLIARDSFINKESAAMARLMKGLIAAEESIAKDPAPIQRYLSKRFGMPEKYYFDIWGDNQFKVSIDRSLMLSLEEQSRWIRKSKGTADRKLPNHFNSFYLDSLKSARPESVSIVY
jgi:NitT/TauT family transport system substrate-binding protein